jgi:hypothetical protein
MMAALSIQNQKTADGMGNSNLVISRVRHDGTTAGTFEIDQSASQVVVIPLDGQTAPTGSLESSGDSTTFLKTVTLNGAAGLCDVITYHQGKVSSVQYDGAGV